MPFTPPKDYSVPVAKFRLWSAKASFPEIKRQQATALQGNAAKAGKAFNSQQALFKTPAPFASAS